MFGRNFLSESTNETSLAELKKLLHQAILDEFENEPERFDRFVQEQQEQPREELIPDKNRLRKYVRINGRTKEMSLQFAASLLGEEVVFDAENERLIINSIPKSLLGQLKKHRG